MRCSIVKEIRKHLGDLSSRHTVCEKHRKKVFVAVSVCLAVSGIFVIFAKNYYTPLPYDPNRMSVEVVKTAVVTNEYGYPLWLDVDDFKDMISADNDHVIDTARLAFRGIGESIEDSTGRTISRDGKNVRVAYYCYKKTLWDSLFVNSDLPIDIGSGYCYSSCIYGRHWQNADYVPQMVEVYYLPVINMDRFDQLSDEEFDRLREQADLVWSGVS